MYIKRKFLLHTVYSFEIVDDNMICALADIIFDHLHIPSFIVIIIITNTVRTKNKI